MTLKSFGIGSERPRIWADGNDLSAVDQATALRIWEGQRYTLHGAPDWAVKENERGKDYPPQFKSDLDWINNTKFAVTPSGNLDKRCRECRETPTWPTRPELRNLSFAEQALYAPNIRRRGWANELMVQERLRAAAAQDAAPKPVQHMTLEESMAENRRRAAAGDPLLYEEESGEAPDHVESVAEMTAKFAAAIAADKAK